MNKMNLRAIAPVLFAFFVMGFVDIVGTATSYIKADMGLSNTLAGVLPNFIFVWFVVCAVPVGILMNRIGRKNTVRISNLITLVGMLVPLPMVLGATTPSLVIYLVTFALLGIGNTILQVALNPLMTNVVEGKNLAGAMTLGQFVKALSSLLGPQLVLLCVVWFEDWNWVFLIYAAVALCSSLWLRFIPIPREERRDVGSTTFGDAFGLLRDPYILQLFLCILLIVGTDIGMNFFIPVIFKDLFGVEHAANMNTLYFAARAVGAFLCAFLLMRFSSKKIFVWTMLAAVIAYLSMMILAAEGSPSVWVQVLFCLLFLPVGFATANVFSIVFSFALRHKPAQSDLISSLLIMGVAGGGAITFLMGYIADKLGVVGGMSVLLVCLCYILVVSVLTLRRKEDNH